MITGLSRQSWHYVEVRLRSVISAVSLILTSGGQHRKKLVSGRVLSVCSDGRTKMKRKFDPKFDLPWLIVFALIGGLAVYLAWKSEPIARYWPQ